jgi:hypothetical protein
MSLSHDQYREFCKARFQAYDRRLRRDRKTGEFDHKRPKLLKSVTTALRAWDKIAGVVR